MNNKRRVIITQEEYLKAQQTIRMFERMEKEKFASLALRQKAGFSPKCLLKDIELSNQLKNVLKQHFGRKFDKTTIQDLSKYTAEDLLSIWAFGRKCLREVENMMFMSELKLKSN